MKFTIMTGILFELLSKKMLSATYLANKYEVTTRTIYRYIEELSLSGVPIETVRGANGGFKIMDTFKLAGSFLTMTEYEAVVNSLNAIYAEVKGDALESAINKLTSAKRGYGAVNVKTGNLVIDAGAWCEEAGYKDKLSKINGAIDDGNIVEFIYHNRNGEKSNRRIEPHTIVFKEGMWYVYAWCYAREEFRFFKIGRMSEIAVLSDKFSRRVLPDHLPFEGWYNGNDLIDVTLKVDKDTISAVEEWLGVENIIKEGDLFLASAKLHDEPSLVGKIMSLGKGVKVLSPNSLKTKIKSAIEELKNNY